MNRFIFLFVFLAFHSLALAQIKVTGQVTDEAKNPLPGVSVLIKDSKKGTTTDFDGKFNIDAKQGEILEFSFMGFHTESRKVTGSTSLTLTIALKEEKKPNK